jgi:16S rRNA U516 pseudouridylate synthase RsuA-like enzyme
MPIAAETLPEHKTSEKDQKSTKKVKIVAPHSPPRPRTPSHIDLPVYAKPPISNKTTFGKKVKAQNRKKIMPLKKASEFLPTIGKLDSDSEGLEPDNIVERRRGDGALSITAA